MPPPYRFLLRAGVFALLVLASATALSPLLPAAGPLARVALGPPVVHGLESLDRTEGVLAYFGDSVVTWGREGPQPDLVLAALVAQEGGRVVQDVSHAAYGPEMFLAQVRYLRRRDVRPSLLLIPISLASFGPDREWQPAWNFGLRRRMLETGLYLPWRAAAVFKYRFGGLDPAAYAALPLRVAGQDVGRLGDLQGPGDAAQAAALPLAARSRLQLLASYATELDDARGWPALGVLLSELRDWDVPCLLYITPLDIERVRRELEPAHVTQVESNLGRLRQVLQAGGLPTLDASEALPSAMFDTHHGLPSEHLVPTGCFRLARRLGAAIRRLP